MRAKIILLFVALFAARQFFDESIYCLSIFDNCAETEGDFKNDETNPPLNIHPAPYEIDPMEVPYIEEEEPVFV